MLIKVYKNLSFKNINSIFFVKNLKTVLKYSNMKKCTISLTLVSNVTMSQYNKTFRDKNGPTDILSFPSHFIKHEIGDIYIAPDFVQTKLKRNKCLCLTGHLDRESMAEYMRLLIAHGVCHLVGMDHEVENDAKDMEIVENFLLSKCRGENSSIHLFKEGADIKF